MIGGRYTTEVAVQPDQRPAAAALTLGCGVAVAGATLLLLGDDHGASSTARNLAVVLGSVPSTLAALALLRRGPAVPTAADRVTLVRVTLAGGCAALTTLVLLGAVPPRTWSLC